MISVKNYIKNKKIFLLLSVLLLAIIIISILSLKKEDKINEYNGSKDLENIKQTIIPNKEYYLFEDNNKKYIFYKTSVSCYSPDKIQIKSIRIKNRKYNNDNKLILDVNVKTEIELGKIPEGMSIDGYYEDSRDIFIEVRDNCKGLIVNGVEYTAYNGGIIHDSKSSKDGYVDNTGKLVLPIEYNKIDYFNEEYLIIENRDRKKGIANKSGKILVECKYASILNHENNTFIVLENAFRSTTVRYNKIGIIDIKGNLIKGLFEIKNNSQVPEYDVYRENNKYGVIDKNLNIIIESKYDDLFIEKGKNKEYYLIVSEDDKLGIMDFKENILIPFQANITLNELEKQYEESYKKN